jgi:hypothetical protein
MSKPGTVIGGPSVSEGEVVRVVVAPDGKGIAAEAWLNGTWVALCPDLSLSRLQISAQERPLRGSEVIVARSTTTRGVLLSFYLRH